MHLKDREMVEEVALWRSRKWYTCITTFAERWNLACSYDLFAKMKKDTVLKLLYSNIKCISSFHQIVRSEL